MKKTHAIVAKVGVLIEHRNKLLLIKEKSWQDTEHRWNFVKGTVEPKLDRTLMAAAKREAREEANARIRITHVLNVLSLYKHNTLFIQCNFIARLVGSHFGVSPLKEQKRYRPDEEIINVALFTKQQLYKMKRSEFISERTYQSIQDWLAGKRYPLSLIKTLTKF